MDGRPDQIEQVRIAAAMSATARRTPAPPTARPHQASYCGFFGLSSTAIPKLTVVPLTLVTVTVTP